MNPSFREILSHLNEHGVEYIVVGGVAAVVHGAPVTTFDLDALVRINEENADRLMTALAELDAKYRIHQEKLVPTRKDILAGGHLLLMTRAGPLDILGSVGDRNRYQDLIEQTDEIALGAGSIRVLTLEALIEQKKQTARPKDRAVLDLLMEVQARRSGG